LPTVNDIAVPWTILRSPAPWIGGSAGGKEGEITFMVAINDMPSFEATLAGTVETIDTGGGNTAERILSMSHPDEPTMVALSWKAEAFGTPGGSGSSIHSTQFSHYRVTVQFATLPYDAAGDTAYYTLSHEVGESYLVVPELAFNFSNGTKSTGEKGILCPIMTINMTTFLSLTPITFALMSLVGRANSVAFDDFPPQTLRFMGVKTDYSQGSLTRSLVKSYSLQFRDPHWNMAMRKDGIWDTVTLGTSGVGPALLTDLNALKYL
jgi:hypothetical protein